MSHSFAKAANSPAEIEALLAQLPPEVVEQVVAELQQELAAQQDNPALGKLASVQAPALTTEYAQGFIGAALAYGLNKTAAKQAYKDALELMAPAEVEAPSYAEVTKQAHYEGFISEAVSRGLTKEAADEIYRSI